METLLAESVAQMSEGQKTRFFERRAKGSPIEGQVALATEVLQESGARPIRRNNGGSRELSESERRQGMMQEADALLFEGMERCRSTAKGVSELVEVNGAFVRKPDGAERLSEPQREDLAFCRLLGMSESDALRVATSKGGIRQN
jgi:hypothetical protein